MKRKSILSGLVIFILLLVGLTSASYAERLEGRVYEGEYLSEPPSAQGLSDMTLKLYGSHSSSILGDEVSSYTTGSDGWYGLETEQGYEFFTIVCEGKSGYSFQGSISVSGSASGENIVYVVPLEGKTLTGNKFWYKREIIPEPPEGTGIIRGAKFNDLDGDSVWEPGDGESGLPNWTFWLDTNNDGLPDQTTKTNSDGFFEFTGLSAGTYTVGEQQQPGWIQTYPPSAGPITTTISEIPPTRGMMFGNHWIGTEPPEEEWDFGDAPDTYKTYKGSGGPYHNVGQVMLGGSVDAETDGQPDPLADADNDDGISFPMGLAVNQLATVIISINAPLGVPAAITGWIDYDHNGTFEDTEKVIGGTYTGAGTAVAWTETFLVPSTATAGDTYARFRIYRSEPGVDMITSPTGYGGEGEVEDYRIEIKPAGTTPSGNLISGIKFNDIDRDGVFEPSNGESGLSNWTIWLDTNNDGMPDQTTQTNSQGGFEFGGLSAGTYTVGEQQEPGWNQTWPLPPGTYTITIPSGPQPTAEFMMFGNYGLDYGDAPAPYPWASHKIKLDGPYAGAVAPDAEHDSQTNPPGMGDDNDGIDDEDGIVQLSDFVVGQPAGLVVNIGGSSPNWCFRVWIDFDRDGVWNNTNEVVMSAAQQPTWSESPPPSFLVPEWAIPGPTYLRLRVWDGSPGSLPSNGPHYPGGPGEVEDHLVEIKAEGNALPPGAIIGGLKFNDLNGNGQQDAGEPGLGGWTIWIDRNSNGVKDSGEETLTNPDGSFYFVGVADGTYMVYEEMKSGWTQTYPGGAGTHTITVQTGQQIPPIIFGNKQNRDYGDAPANYPSASHELGGPWLGSIPPDAESGMQPNPPGLGDDTTGIPDEDGVTFLTDLVPGQPYAAVLFHMDPNGPYRIVQGWIDFNKDGHWDDQAEFVGWVGNGGGGPAYAFFGGNIVPAGTTPGKTYARFRICRAPDFFVHINPDGDLGPGEVEDYEVEIVADGNTLPPGGMVQGYKFNDLNSNGMWDANEPALAGWTIWLDANQNGIEDANDLYTQTGTSGSFLFAGLAAGQYLLGEVQQPGWTQTYPGGSGTHTVTADPNLPSWARLFGNQQTGPGGPREEQEPHVKWSQPPIEIDPNVDTQPVFCGWDEPARSTEQTGQIRQWRMDADDFRCFGPIPITRIRWWGGYKAWTQPEMPETQPEAWHIGFWANQVQGLAPDQLYLERLVWSLEIADERVHREPAGLTEFPQQLMESCFVYEVQLEPQEWFHQADFPSNEDIFWISITAIYPPDVKQVNQWGWTTRPHIWGNGAVMPAIMGDWPTFDERLFPGRIYPIENSLLCGQNQAYDLCFELLTEQPWVKWDSPFTNLREWPHHEDHESYAIEDPNGDVLIRQRVSDDWLCERRSPVIAVAWNGSYMGYGYEACTCENSTKPISPDHFVLTLRTNAPADANIPYEHPEPKVWEYEATDFDEVLVGFDKHPQGEPNEAVFRYMVRLPEDSWFQQDTPEQKYWLSIMAVYKGTAADTIIYPWAWTNHQCAFGSTALGLDFTDQDTQTNFLYDQTSERIDMSFTLYTLP